MGRRGDAAKGGREGPKRAPGRGVGTFGVLGGRVLGEVTGSVAQDGFVGHDFGGVRESGKRVAHGFILAHSDIR